MKITTSLRRADKSAITKLTTIVLFLSLFSTLSAQKEVPIEEIKLQIAQLPDNEKLTELNRLAGQITQNKDYYPFLQLYRDEAIRQNDTLHLQDAYLYTNSHFYSAYPDSMRYWLAKAEPLFLATKRYEDLFRMKAWNIFLLSSERKNSEVIPAVEELKQLSVKYNFPEGIEMADQAFAYYLIANKHFDEAEQIYLRVLDDMKKRDAPLEKQYNVIKLLYRGMNTPDRKLFYLDMASQFIKKCKEDGLQGLGDDEAFIQSEYSLYLNYANIYSIKKQFDEAFEFTRKAEELVDKYKLERHRMEINHIYLIHYMNSNQYEKALPYAELLEKDTRQRNIASRIYGILNSKARIYTHLGRYKESSEVLYEMISLNDSINKQSYLDQLADMQTKYEVEKLELKNERMQSEAEASNTRILILLVGCGILLSVILVLFYLLFVIQRQKRDLLIAKERAEESDRMKSSFLANMNHEIRTPLNAIVGFSQVLIEEEDPESRREFSEIIINNNELLQRLIGDVLDFSKLESNSMMLIYSMQDIPALMREIYNMIAIRMSDKVELRLDPGKPLVMSTDRNRLVQIITNLLTNAIKHTHEGHIRFGFDLVDNNEVCFYVEDTGEGIEKSQLESIFNRFVQLANGHKGVGLGLAICKGLVAKMGGRIWVTSVVGKGSTFFVQLPITVEEDKNRIS